MRWTDKSMGSTFDYTWPTINQAFAAGKIGMFINGSDIYTFLVQAANLDPAIYGIAPLPLAKNKTAGVLGGGSIAVVRPDSKGAKLAAAMKWIDFFYMEKLIKKPAALRDAKILVANKQPVGVPAFPIFNKAQYSSRTGGSSRTSTFRPTQMAPFLKGDLQAEPLPGARGLDAERVPRARSGRPGGVCGQECQHRRPARAGERSRPEGHQGRELAS